MTLRQLIAANLIAARADDDVDLLEYWLYCARHLPKN
jgi:hypothetical protein